MYANNFLKKSRNKTKKYIYVNKYIENNKVLKFRICECIKFLISHNSDFLKLKLHNYVDPNNYDNFFKAFSLM